LKNGEKINTTKKIIYVIVGIISMILGAFMYLAFLIVTTIIVLFITDYSFRSDVINDITSLDLLGLPFVVWVIFIALGVLLIIGGHKILQRNKQGKTEEELKQNAGKIVVVLTDITLWLKKIFSKVAKVALFLVGFALLVIFVSGMGIISILDRFFPGEVWVRYLDESFVWGNLPLFPILLLAPLLLVFIVYGIGSIVFNIINSRIDETETIVMTVLVIIAVVVLLVGRVHIIVPDIILLVNNEHQIAEAERWRLRSVRGRSIDYYLVIYPRYDSIRAFRIDREMRRELVDFIRATNYPRTINWDTTTGIINRPIRFYYLPHAEFAFYFTEIMP